MQLFSSRIGRPQLVENLFIQVRSALNRLLQRKAHRAGQPLKHSEHELQAALEQRLSLLQQAFDQQTLLFRMAVHDLRMPLTSIQGYTDLLRQGSYGSLTDEQVTVLRKIAYSALFLDRLASGLLDSISAEDHTLNLAHEPFDPSQLAQKALDDCFPQALRQGLTLQFHHVGDLPMIVGDSYRVRQVLFNLLGNALRYTATGGITLTVEALADVVEFRVEDTGVGIAEEVQELIWKPFTQVGTSGEGLGIGLYTVQQLTQAMGGSVGMRSTLGTGSVFWIRLPYQNKMLEKTIG